VALAGRATEELVLGDVTTGAQNDFQQATDVARRMVTRWGMSERLGRVALTAASEGYLGESEGPRAYSEETARLVDDEIKLIVEGQYARVTAMLEEHRVTLDEVVSVLLVRETLHQDEFATLMRGETLPEPPPVADPPSPPQDAAEGAEGPRPAGGVAPRGPEASPEPG
jgi:cell division protease FtsH